MLFLLVLVAFFAFSSAQQSAVPKDVDVFNLNYNRNQRNARAHILRSFDVIPTEVSRVDLYKISQCFKKIIFSLSRRGKHLRV